MAGVGWAAMLSLASTEGGDGAAMMAALVAASMPATFLQVWRMGRDLKQEARAQRVKA